MNSHSKGNVSLCRHLCVFKNLIAVIAFVLVSAGVVRAQYVEGTYDETFYNKFTYEWTDASGKKHISTLAEPATEYEQIVEFLREVYINPAVPGFVKDYCWTDSQAAAHPDNTYSVVPYEPCVGIGNPYHMENLEKVETPVEGATAILVEVDDNYDGKHGVNGRDLPSNLADQCEWYLRQIKRVSILMHQRYVSKDVSPENPGFLFNYVGPLNRFFVITKGNNRIALNSNYDDNGVVDPNSTVYRGHAPFFHMYEEFSPANSGPIYNAYHDMDRGSAFAVDHNCTTIMGQNHTTVMSPALAADNSNADDFHDYSGNFMFFLPDYRFAGDNRTNDNVHIYGWYTYYSGKRPYYFFNKLSAEINKKPQLVSKNGSDWENNPDVLGVANVRVEWTSTYNDIVGYEANESFYVYRVINDVVQPEPVPASQLVVPGYDEETGTDYPNKIHLGGRLDEGDDLTLDPSVIVSRISHPSIYVKEPRYAESYNVYYIVKGRRYKTDFELVESNVVTSLIPGVSEKNALNIQIDGQRKSTHVIGEHRNYYEHRIDLIDNNYYAGTDVTLQRRHIRTADDATVATPTQFVLMRYVGNDITNAEEVARIKMTKTVVDRWNQFVFSGDVIYKNDPSRNETDITLCKATGIKYVTSAGQTLSGQSLVDAITNKNITLDQLSDYTEKDPDTGEEVRVNAVLNVLALDRNEALGRYKDAIYTFFDVFSVNTNDGTNPDSYKYYIDYVPAVFVNNEVAAFSDRSNTFEFSVPKSGLKAGYVPYTEEQILADDEYEGRLAANIPGIQFERNINVNVSRYVIYRISEDNRTPVVVARATRQPNGTLAYQRLNDKGVLVSYDKSSNSTRPAIALPYGAGVGDEFDIVVEYTSGNTYGNRVAYIYDIPYPHIYDVTIKGKASTIYPDKWDYTATVDWNSQKLASPVADDESQYYTRYGYRAWGSGGKVDEESPVYERHYDLRSADNNVNKAPLKSARASVPNQDDFISKQHDFTAHQATFADPVQYNAHVRLYAQLPSSMNISESDAPGYLVSDNTFVRSIDSPNSYITGVDEIADDDSTAPVEYYNLQGLRVENPVPGTIVIRRQGNTVTKMQVK